MKFFMVLTMLMPSIAMAKEYKFVTTYNGGTLQFKTEAKTWEEAYTKEAQFCFDFFTKRVKLMTEETGLDIIDACANPKEQ
jgi:hypothetical protein